MRELSEFIINLQTDQPEINSLGINTILYRFKHKVSFYNVQKSTSKETEKTIKELDKFFKPYIHCYSRFSGIGRLPNTLLFGADTIGPDLSKTFSKLITEAKDKEAYYQKAQFWRNAIKESGRYLNSGDIEIAEMHGLTTDEIIYAVPPGISLAMSLLNRGNGTYVTFYKPESMSDMISSQLYAAPVFSSIEHILVAWENQFNLQKP